MPVQPAEREPASAGGIRAQRAFSTIRFRSRRIFPRKSGRRLPDGIR
ncbi:hypothetical protein KAH81_06980 [bacterium]|nr:hypothetical protein [bacterium]